MLCRYNVPNFTTDYRRIDDFTAVWKIRAPLWDGEGIVSYGDEIRIENQYPPEKKWMTRYNVPNFTNDYSNVRTGAATWKIHDSRGNAQRGVIDCNDVVTLVNQYPPQYYFLRRYNMPNFTTAVNGPAEQWRLRPVCGSLTMRGGWVSKQFFHVDAGVSYTYRVGVKNSSSITQRNSWERTVSAEMSSGFEFYGTSLSVTISESYTRVSEQTVSHAFEQTWESEITLNPTVSGQMWQFSVGASGPCGNTEVDTNTLVMTNDTEIATMLPAWLVRRCQCSSRPMHQA